MLQFFPRTSCLFDFSPQYFCPRTRKYFILYYMHQNSYARWSLLECIFCFALKKTFSTFLCQIVPQRMSGESDKYRMCRQNCPVRRGRMLLGNLRTSGFLKGYIWMFFIYSYQRTDGVIEGWFPLQIFDWILRLSPSFHTYYYLILTWIKSIKVRFGSISASC